MLKVLASIADVKPGVRAFACAGLPGPQYSLPSDTLLQVPMHALHHSDRSASMSMPVASRQKTPIQCYLEATVFHELTVVGTMILYLVGCPCLVLSSCSIFGRYEGDERIADLINALHHHTSCLTW